MNQPTLKGHAEPHLQVAFFRWLARLVVPQGGDRRSMAFNLYPPLLIAFSILWSQSALADPARHRYFPGKAAHGFPPPPTAPYI